jgi:predicted ATPase
MIEQVTAGRKLPAEVTEQIIGKTDGVPLFVEELTKTVLESGLLVEETGGYRLERPLPPLAIPATLQDSLMARLDRLAPVKETAQIGATIGREFSYALLSIVVESDRAGLDAALAQLETAELVSRRGVPPDAVYVFKHALVQDTAYESLLRSRRQVLHQRIAVSLRDHFPAIAETEPAMIAHHFTRAGEPVEAIEWWSKAGDQARRRFAFAAAIGHLGKAINLAEALPDGPERRLARLRLQIAYANAHLHARGPGAPEPTAAFARAREIAARTGDAPERFSAYYGLWVSHFVRGELPSAREVAEAALRDIIGRRGSSESSMVYRALGMTCYAEGRYSDARAHLEQSLSCYSPDHDRGMQWFGVDTAVATMVWLAIAIWPLGEIDRACRLIDDLVIRAKQIEHVPTLVYAHSVICTFEAVRRDSSRALAQSEATLALAREHEMPLYMAMGTFFQGWAHSFAGNRESGLTEMREGTLLMRDQFPLHIALVLELLAEEVAAEGRCEDALTILDDAFVEIEQMGHQAYTAEVHRTRGEILLRRDAADIARAEEAFTRALEIARQQQTKTFELRAAVALAQLYWATDRASSARDLLQPVINAFGRGVELPELAEAERLTELKLTGGS